jgi:hypothetical protein
MARILYISHGVSSSTTNFTPEVLTLATFRPWKERVTPSVSVARHQFSYLRSGYRMQECRGLLEVGRVKAFVTSWLSTQ